MADEFDFDALLDQQLEAQAGATPAFDPYTTINDGSLQLAGSQKEYDLDGMAAAKQRNIEKSLVGKLGIDDSGFGRDLTNFGAVFASGTSHLAGTLINLPIGAAADLGQAGVTEDAIQAYNRKLSGQEQEGDTDLLNQTAAGDDGITQTMEQRLQGVQGLRDAAKSVRDFFDISSIVETTKRDKLSADIADETKEAVSNLREASGLYDAGDRVGAVKSATTGVVQALGGAGSAVLENPGATLEYAVENLPQLLTAAKSVIGGVVSNAAYASDELNKGYEEYAKANNGEIPDQEDRIKMGATAASLALAEEVGDLSVLKSARAVRTGVTGSVKEIADSTVKEGVTEGYQTWGEAQVKLEDAKLEDIIESATIGAAVGGTFAGGGQVANLGNRKAGEIETNREANEKVKNAGETGDITELADPRSPAYNPVGAVTALQANAMKADAAPEVVAKNLEQADSIEKSLAQEVSAAEQNEFIMSEQGQALVAQRIEAAQSALDTDPQVDREKVTAQIEALKGFQEQAAARTPEEAQAGAEYLSRVRQQLTDTRKAVQGIQAATGPNDTQVQEIVSQVQAAAPETAQPAAEKLMTLTMTNPDAVDTAQLSSLASDENSGLNDNQRVALQAFSEAQEALNELKGMSVTTDIQNGSQDFKGLPQYRNAVRVAIADGNTDAAIQQVEQLASFAQSRAAKHEAISNAYDQVTGTNESIRLVRDNSGEWVQAPASMTARQVKNAGGVEVSGRSHKLRDAVGLEATVLSKAAQSLSALVKAAPTPTVQAPTQTAATTTTTPTATTAPTEQAASAVETAPPAAITSLDDALAMGEDAYVQAINPSGETNDEDGSAKLVRGDLADPENAQVIKELDDGVTIERDEDGSFYARQGGDTLAEMSNQDDEVNVNVLPEARGKGIAVALAVEFMRANPGFNAGSLTPGGEAVVRAAYRRLQAEKVATPTNGPVTSEEGVNSTETAPADVAVTGELTVIKNSSEIRGEPVPADRYQDTNLVGAYFEQVAAKDDSATERPLVATPNFATAVRTGLVKVADYLDQAVSGQQQSAIKRFFGFQRTAQPIIEAGLKKREGAGERYAFRDYAQFLINPDGSIDENLSTAISFAAFQWANDTASQLVNTDEGINAILGRDSQDEVTPNAYDKLAYIGTRQAVVASQLGAKIAEALGLALLDNAPSNERSRMEASLGMHAINLLTKAGLAQIKTISDVDLQTLMGSDQKGNARTKHFFVAPATREVNGRVVPSEIAAAFKEATVGSQSVLDKLFGSQQNGTEPSFEPVPFNQQYAKRTGQEVPGRLAKILKGEGKKPHYLRQDVWQVWGNLTTDARYEIAGVVDTTDVPTHVYNLASQEAKNDGLRAQVDNAQQFFSKLTELSPDGLDQPLHFGRSVWKPQRVGITANVINPQTMKVHRHLLRMESWTVKISLTDQPAMDGFKLRMLEGFGVKTEAKSTAQVLAGYDAKVNTPVIQAAVNALAETLAGEAVDLAANEAAILAGVKAGGEAFHSLDALIALAHEKLARDNGAESFETQMMGEVDGITNGPMLSLLMLGAKDFETLNRGGFFQIDSEFTQFNDFHGEAGNLDLYESTVDAVLVRLGNDEKLAALEVITGNLKNPDGTVSSKGRKVIKQPLTAMMFGSNTATAVNGMADGFVTSIYERIQESKDQAGLTKILTAVNQLIASQNSNKRLQLNTGMDLETALQTTLNATQEKAVKDAFQQLLGDHAKAALEDTYEVFIARRDVINKTAGLAYELYQAAFDAKVNQALQGSTLPKNNAGEAMTGLTKAQVQKIRDDLKDMEPLLNTALSKASNQLDSGMLMAKSKRELNPAFAFGSEVHFGQPVDYIDTDGSVKNVMSLSASGMDTRMDGPGVAPLITGIHSTDSSISHTAIKDHNVLNIHDAHGAAMDDVQGAGQRLNQATYQNMLNYSVASEMVATLERTITGFAQLMNDPALTAELNEKLKTILADRKTTVATQLDQIRHVATEADTAKLSMMADMTAVGQYATDGGSYMVTDADRAAATEARNNVGKNFNDDALVVADEIDSFAETAPVVNQASPAVPLANDSIQTLAPSTTLNTFERLKLEGSEQLKNDVATVEAVMVAKNIPLASAKSVLSESRAADLVEATEQATVRRVSVWGEIGTPVNVSDQALVDLLTDNEEITARGLAQALEARSTNPYTKKLLQALAKLARADLPVVLVTGDTGPDGAIGSGVTKARGWYAQQGDFDAMYVKSPDFVESGINEEMLVHELLHTVTGRVIQQSLDGKASPEVTRLVDELEALRVQAKKAIDANSALSVKYSNAVSNVHELVSWGMTNAGFQQDVLGKIQVADRTPNTLLTGLHKFINTLTSLVFGGRAVSERNGMGLLIANTSGLFAEAKTQMDARNSMTLKYEDAMDDANKMSTLEVFQALEDNRPSSPEHTAHMQNMINQIVDNLHGPMGAFRNEVARGQAMTTADAILKGFNEGRLPFGSQALASAFVTNAQEAFVLEQLEATFQESMNNGEGLFIRNALENLWREARTRLTPKSFYAGDWNQATQAEKDVATEKYDFLFRPGQYAGARNDYLSRFAALGLASEEVSNALGFRTDDLERDTQGVPLATRLRNLFVRLLAKLSSLHTKVKPGDVANASLFTLVDRLVDIEANRRSRIADRKLSWLDQVENLAASSGNKAREKADAFGQSAIFKSSRSSFVRLTGNVISTLAGDRVDLVLDGIQRVRDQAFSNQQQGILAGTFTEVRGIHEGNATADALAKQSRADQIARQKQIEYTVEQVNAAFENGGQNLTPEIKAALTRTLLRTNMSELHAAIGFDAMREAIESPAAMQKLREELERQVSEIGNGAYYIRMVKDLAFNRVVGGNVNPNLMLNTFNIARLYGTGKVAPTNVSKITPLLDQLQAVYGYEYAPTKDKLLMKQVLRTESRRGADNGIEMVLKLHKGLQEKSKVLNFEGAEALRISGYTPDIFDSKIEVKVISALDLPAYQKYGYKYVGQVQNDPAVLESNNRVMISRRGSGQTSILTGAMSYTGLHRKGTSAPREELNLLSDEDDTGNNGSLKIIKSQLANEISDMFNTPLDYDPRKQQTQRVAPLVNANGQVRDFRYMMTENNRDALLDRDNSMDQVLGTMSGQIIDKVNTTATNNDVVTSMYSQYKEDYNNRPSSYLTVGLDSTDPELKELYMLLPKATKDQIRKVWGSNNMQIPADQLNLVMGYRKYSLTAPFTIKERAKTLKDGGFDMDAELLEENLNFVERALVSVSESILGKKAALQIGRAEDVVQELVKAAKDIYVVKNIFTLVGNIISNTTLLGWYGVPIADAAKNSAIAIEAAMQYRKDNKQLIQLQTAVEIGYLPNGALSVLDEIAVLRDRMARNPIKRLIDAGLMPTIVEDVEASDSQYSYQSLLQKKVEKYTNKLPKFVRDVGRNVYMTHDTATYKFLSQTTQLSDLVSRYALYQHLTTRARDPMSETDALREVEEAFVNYDNPSHRSMQFMNDMGIFMFTKYYLRIQKVIGRLVRTNPARGLALVAANHAVSGLQSVMDSSWLNKLGGNPFSMGPLNFPSSLGELPVIKGLMKVF